MFTIKVNKIENTATSDGGIAIDASGHVTVDGQQLPSTGALSNRNLIINGAMQVDQRGTSTGVDTTGYYAVDRMRISQNSILTARYTRERSTDAPDGFASSLKVTTTTAEGSVGAADGYRPLHYKIEGQDLQQLQYGTSGAKSLTLSFYVKSSVTGTYGLTFRRIETQERIITATYTISSANTWEFKTITITGDTSSSITNDHANRFEVYWIGGTGTDETATDTSGSWTNYVSTGFSFGHSSSVQLQNTLNSTWLITGVQLEVGEKATPFEHRSYGDELARCQRYFQFVPYFSGSSGYLVGSVHYHYAQVFAPMRITPSAPTPSGSGTVSIAAGGADGYRYPILFVTSNASISSFYTASCSAEL